MSPHYLLVAPLVLGATTVYPVGCNDTMAILVPSVITVSPVGTTVIRVSLKYLLLAPIVL